MRRAPTTTRPGSKPRRIADERTARARRMLCHDSERRTERGAPMDRQQQARTRRMAAWLLSASALAATLLWPTHAAHGRNDAPAARTVATRGALTADELANIDVFKRI